jgi:hypothetical protein
MIVQATVILLVILIVANIGVGVYNQFYPPCFDADEYFKGARRLPDGAIAELGSIQSGTDRHYVGARIVETDDPTVIGIKSWNSVYGETERHMGMEHPIFAEDDDEYGSTTVREVSKAKPRQRVADTIDPVTGNIIPGKKVSQDKDDTYDAISAMYPTSSQLSGTTSKSNTDIGGKIVTFEEELEGVKTTPRSYVGSKKSSNPTAFRNSMERDGYS